MDLCTSWRDTGLKKSSGCTFTDSFSEIQRNELILNDIIALLTLDPFDP